MTDDIRDTIDALNRDGLHRTLRTVEPIEGARIRVDGREVINFASNDYLGLRRHPDLVAAAEAAMRQYGVGAGASRLLAGSSPVHAELESVLAAFLGRERALVFPTGFQTNLGVLTSLADQGDVIILDALCHASLIDAARLSKARMRVFRHADVAGLEALLEKHASYRRRVVVTEGVFSMDGDVAPLGEIVALVERHDAWLVLDDAHAFGVLGARGTGTVEHLGVTLPHRSVTIATLSKAAGSQGGFVAADADVVDLLVNRARSFIYTTGLAIPAAAAGAAAVRLIGEGSQRRRLVEVIAKARRGLREIAPAVPEGVTPIVPVVVGEVDRTVALAEALFERGVFAPAIRPPTVPEGTARLRISLSAGHTDADLDRLADALRGAAGALGFSLDRGDART